MMLYYQLHLRTDNYTTHITTLTTSIATFFDQIKEQK